MSHGRFVSFLRESILTWKKAPRPSTRFSLAMPLTRPLMRPDISFVFREFARMSELSLRIASLIVDKALERGRELGLAPLTVVALDAGGHLKAAKREDGSSLLRPEIAMGKAWGVLGM